MTLRVVPAGLAAARAAVEALTARLTAAFSVRGGEHAAVAARGAQELGRSGVGVGESGTSYAMGDAAAAASYLFAGG